MASSSDPNRTKKSKGRYVPSRYKQSAENYSSHCSDETSSGPNKFYLSKNPRLLSGTLHQTKVNRTTAKKTHSTPEIPGTARPNFDESAIPNASCTITTCQKKDRLRQKTLSSSGQKTLSVKANILENVSSHGHYAGKKSKSSLNQSQADLEAELDICYAQYQLNLLLENKARKSLHDKSKVALEKIYEVFCYIQILLGKHECMKKSLNEVSFVLELQEHLHKQERMLDPFLKIQDALEKQYEEIALAVDCVRHKLLIEEVISPEGSEEEIIQLMNNIDNFLNLILTSVGNVDEVVASADAADVFVKKGKLTSDEIKRGLELLTEARNLMLSETSLKFASLCLEDQT